MNIMRNNNDKTDKNEKVECIDCKRETQKEAPANASSSDGMKCEIPYTKVNSCMIKNEGQITKCVREWDEFKACHDKNRR
mmetsp:Transcript_10397/g.14681  ORF Transcript_10397/g.14681 Transcript_10397/m.14681 type:complete len:80 (-) Transcript_10397:334-573(-)